MLQVLGETFKKAQTSNINLVISRPESDSLVTQVDIEGVGWMGGLKAGGRVPSHLILFLHTSTQMAEDFENDLTELAQLWKKARKDAVHLIGVHR